jgi:uncharacterized protein (TIGR00299 family) protein
LSEGVTGGLAVHRFALVRDVCPHDHVHSETDRSDHQSHAHHDADHDNHCSSVGHGAHGTSFSHLAARITEASLQPGTADNAVAILRRLAESESRMHRVAIDDVHFHELADWDSLMDVVAAGSIAAALAGCTWSVSSLPRGHGLVRTQHGLLPVPAPATADLLRGFKWRDDGVEGERVTPTGAAILAHLVKDPGSGASGVLTASGMGAGTRSFAALPNILRVLVYSSGPAMTDDAVRHDEVIVVSFDVDDMTGEEIGTACDKLRALADVLDLSTGVRQGKKGRPLHEFRLLVHPDSLEAVSEACLCETSTLGLRWRREGRFCLPRSCETTEVEGIRLRRKSATRPSSGVTRKVESDDLAEVMGLARRRHLKSRAERETEDD